MKPQFYYKTGGGAGGGGGGGAKGKTAGGGGLIATSNPAAYTTPAVRSIGNNTVHDEYVLEIGQERILRQTDKAVGIATRNSQYAKYQRGESPSLEWIPKSQIEGWYQGGGGQKGGLVLNPRWAVNNQSLRGLRYYPMKEWNLT